jgi:hypothetical protein
MSAAEDWSSLRLPEYARGELGILCAVRQDTIANSARDFCTAIKICLERMALPGAERVRSVFEAAPDLAIFTAEREFLLDMLTSDKAAQADVRGLLSAAMTLRVYSIEQLYALLRVYVVVDELPGSLNTAFELYQKFLDGELEKHRPIDVIFGFRDEIIDALLVWADGEFETDEAFEYFLKDMFREGV